MMNVHELRGQNTLLAKHTNFLIPENTFRGHSRTSGPKVTESTVYLQEGSDIYDIISKTLGPGVENKLDLFS